MISGYLTGDAEVVRKLAALGPSLRQELKAGIGRAVLKLQREAVRNVTGRVLNVRTGTLRRSIDQGNPSSLKNPVIDEGNRIVGIVSTNVKYARIHEYGFTGTVTVKEHLRMQKKAFGRPITPREVTVRSHSARMNLPARSFLRSALREMEASGEIANEIEAAIARAIA